MNATEPPDSVTDDAIFSTQKPWHPPNDTMIINGDFTYPPPHRSCCVPGPVPLAIYIVAPTLLIFLFSLVRCLTRFIRNIFEGNHQANSIHRPGHSHHSRESPQTQKNETLKKKFIKEFENISSKSSDQKIADVEANIGETNEENATSDTDKVTGKQNFVTDDRSCPICFDHYGEKTEEVFIGQLKKCGHFYHFDCIWPWLEQKGSCPLCRGNITLKETDIRGTTLGHVLAKKRETAMEKNKQSTHVINETTNHNAEIGISETSENTSEEENKPNKNETVLDINATQNIDTNQAPGSEATDNNTRQASGSEVTVIAGTTRKLGSEVV